MRRGQIFPTYLKSLTPICLFTTQLLWQYDDVSGPFTLSTSNVKPVFWLKISKYRQNRAPKWWFLGKRGVNVKFWFCNPEKAHPCMEPHLLTYFSSKSVVASSTLLVYPLLTTNTLYWITTNTCAAYTTQPSYSLLRGLLTFSTYHNYYYYYYY